MPIFPLRPRGPRARLGVAIAAMGCLAAASVASGGTTAPRPHGGSLQYFADGRARTAEPESLAAARGVAGRALTSSRVPAKTVDSRSTASTGGVPATTSSTRTSTSTTGRPGSGGTTTSTTSTTIPVDPDPGYHVPTGPTASAVAFGLDAAHSGGHDDPALAENPKLRWTRRFIQQPQSSASAVGYPLVVGGRIFVTVAHGEPNGHLVYGSKLYALDAETGEDAWGPIDLGGVYGFSAAAYDNGRVFVINGDGLLQAFDAQTGSHRWTIDLPFQYSFDSPPTARHGLVFTGGAGSGGTVYAVSQDTGVLQWTASVANGSSSSPAVGDDAVYVDYPCNTYAFRPATGAQIWHRSTGCSGGGGRTPVLHDGRLWARYNGVVVDAADGHELGAASSGPLPAFAGSRGFFVLGEALEAHAVDNNRGAVAVRG